MNMRQQIKAKLRELANGEGNPGDIADWALAVIKGDDPELEADDSWRALDRLAGADLLEAPDTPLHTVVDFQLWNSEYEA